MRLIRLTLLVLLIGLGGCDLYGNREGIGILGPDGGWFVCYDDNDCNGI